MVLNILGCSYTYNMPILEASNRFIQLVLSIHSSESNANTIWLQHGVVIRGGQIRPTSSNPEDYVVHDVMLWDPWSFFFSNLTSSCPNCLECSGMTQSLRATRWKDSRTKCDELCLYGLTNRVLPVSGVYVCDLRHQIARDPSILSQVLGCFAHSICLISQGWSDERTV